MKNKMAKEDLRKPKSAEEMTKDILAALRMKDAPEAILIEEYLKVQIKRHKEYERKT